MDESDKAVTFEVVLHRKPGQSLGLTLVEKPIPFSLDPSGKYTSELQFEFCSYQGTAGMADKLATPTWKSVV